MFIILKRNLLVATALTTMVVGSMGGPVYGVEPNVIETIGQEIRKGAARQVAPIAARAIVREFENKVLRGTPYVVQLPSGEVVPVLDNSPVLGKLTATIFEKIGLQPIGTVLKAAVQTPLVKNYMEFKIKTALTDVAENRIQAMLENTDILEAAVGIGNFAKKAMGFAGDRMKGDDAKTAEYKKLANLSQQMKTQLSSSLSIDEKAAQYYQDYFDMLIRSTIRGYLEEASASFLSTLSKDALKAAEAQADEYVIKPVGAAGALAGGALGAAGGGVGAAAGGAAGWLAADLGAKNAKQRFVALIDQKRGEKVKDLARVISLGVLPLTEYEVMRPDIGLQSKKESIEPQKEAGDWVMVDQYALDSSTGPTEIETEQTLVVVPEDTLVAKNALLDSWNVLTPTPAPSFGGYAKAGGESVVSKVSGAVKGAYNWLFGAPVDVQPSAPSAQQVLEEIQAEAEAGYAETQVTPPSPQQVLEEIQAEAEAGYAETQATPSPVKGSSWWKIW